MSYTSNEKLAYAKKALYLYDHGDRSRLSKERAEHIRTLIKESEQEKLRRQRRER